MAADITAEKGLDPKAELILRMLGKSRVLTTTMLADLVEVSPSRARDLTKEGRDWGLLESVAKRQIGGEKVWYLSERGGEQVRQVADDKIVVPTKDQAAGVLQIHTLGVNEACCAMVRGARETDDECGPLHWDLEQSIRYGPNRDNWLRADAILRYIRVINPDTFEMRVRNYAIELDRSNEPTDVLREKLRHYAQALAYIHPGDSDPLWKKRWPSFPHVLLVLAGRGDDTPKQLNRRLQMALRLSLTDPVVQAASTKLHVSMCRLDELSKLGSNADVFWPLDLELAESGGLAPRSLAGIDDLWAQRDRERRATEPAPAPDVAIAPTHESLAPVDPYGPPQLSLPDSSDHHGEHDFSRPL